MAIRLYFDALPDESYSIIPAALPRPPAGPGLSTEQAANRTARFLPARDDKEEPAIDLAGALVIAWVRDGELNVNIGLESADLSVYRAAGEDQLIPVRVMIMGDEIASYDASPLGGEIVLSPGASSPAVPGRHHQERRPKATSPHAPGGPGKRGR